MIQHHIHLERSYAKPCISFILYYRARLKWHNCKKGNHLRRLNTSGDYTELKMCIRYINTLRPSDAYTPMNYGNIGSDNGLSSGRRQAIIWTNAGYFWTGTPGTNFTEIEVQTFSYKKMYLKISSGKRRPFCLGLNLLSPISISPWGQEPTFLWLMSLKTN